MSQIGSLLELLFYQHLRGYQLVEGCVREYVFAEPRKWRFDFAWPELEQEGGWERGSKVPARYVDEIPFSEIQKRPSPLTSFLRKAG